MKLNDPENYERMCEPYTDTASVKHTMAAFRDELYALRQKYRIADLTVIAEVRTRIGGEDNVMRSLAQFGDRFRQMELLLWGAERVHSDDMELVAGLVKRLESAKNGQMELPVDGDAP